MRTPELHFKLSLVLSRSYGPGRYDSEYEENHRDYPVGHVRWTEKRNMGADCQAEKCFLGDHCDRRSVHEFFERDGRTTALAYGFQGEFDLPISLRTTQIPADQKTAEKF